jgi:LysM repeat protein
VAAGQKLVVPLTPSGLLASRAIRPDPTTVTAPPAPAREVPGDAKASGRATLTYYVRSGDSLYSIAKQFGTTVANIRSWNDLKSDRIRPGERLTIHTSR